MIRIPLLCTEGVEKKVVLQDVGFILASDVIDYILEHGTDDAAASSFFTDGISSVEQFWKHELPTHIERLGLREEDRPLTLPLMWHEDEVPHWHGSTGTFWSWSTPLAFGGAWSSRHCFVGLTTSSICPKTRPEILKVLAWDLEALRKGIRPSHDHLGKPLLRRRAQLAGKPFRMKAAFAYWKGDAEARYMAHETWFAKVTQSVSCLLFSFV